MGSQIRRVMEWHAKERRCADSRAGSSYFLKCNMPISFFRVILIIRVPPRNLDLALWGPLLRIFAKFQKGPLLGGFLHQKKHKLYAKEYGNLPINYTLTLNLFAVVLKIFDTLDRWKLSRCVSCVPLSISDGPPDKRPTASANTAPLPAPMHPT
jgi:hypothetical protein